MSDRPLVFTEQEQLQLVELENQAKGFSNFKLAVARSLSTGQDALIISSLLKFLNDMENQSIRQIEEIKASAKQRNTEAKVN